MPRCGVLGWPVRHSRSPAMHEAGYAAVETVRGLPGAGFAGANVTIPHKEAAAAIADDATPAVRAIGAANTLTFHDGRIHADNTDAPGLIDALPRPAEGASALVLGAGGTARAAVWALLDAGAADVMVWNRTRERAERLCAEIGGRVVDAPVPPADLLLNTTSVGLQWGEDPFKALPLSADALSGYPCLVDLVYGTAPTALATAARAAGAEVVDGLELLVRQGARSFERWTGRAAPLDILRAAARGDAAG
jgi:shikimate dehydrogenase